jgi:hypothetical protein
MQIGEKHIPGIITVEKARISHCLLVVAEWADADVILREIVAEHSSD